MLNHKVDCKKNARKLCGYRPFRKKSLFHYCLCHCNFVYLQALHTERIERDNNPGQLTKSFRSCPIVSSATELALQQTHVLQSSAARRRLQANHHLCCHGPSQSAVCNNNGGRHGERGGGRVTAAATPCWYGVRPPETFKDDLARNKLLLIVRRISRDCQPFCDSVGSHSEPPLPPPTAIYIYLRFNWEASDRLSESVIEIRTQCGYFNQGWLL